MNCVQRELYIKGRCTCKKTLYLYTVIQLFNPHAPVHTRRSFPFTASLTTISILAFLLRSKKVNQHDENPKITLRIHSLLRNK